MKKQALAFVLALLLAGQSSTVWAEATSVKDTFSNLLKDERNFHYQENPGTGPRGEPRPVARSMRRVSPADQERRIQATEAFLERLIAIDASSLDEEGQLNHAMLRYKLHSDLVMLRHRTWRLPMYSDSGFHTSPAQMWRSVNFRSLQDYDAYIERLTDIPRYLAENQANLRQGMVESFTMPKVVLDGLLSTFAALSDVTVEDSPFYRPFRSLPDFISEAEAAALREKATTVIRDQVIPAYSGLNEFMRGEYYAAARTDIGAYSLQGGKDYYDAMVRHYTTLNITPDEVHAIGLAEVARIRSEMEVIIKESGFKGTFSEFLAFLRTDSQFYAKTAKELVMTASYIAKQIDGRLPKLFGRLPRQPYGVEPVPDTLAPNYTTGRYFSAPLDAPRGGYYWVNTYALETRPLYALPALTLHEAMPGHHLQIALAAEQVDVPDFRLDIYPHAFGEGWGLYAEKLGLELDVYNTPYEHFGRLTYEMWRASRLVIDTGIHAKGWSRKQAIALLEENSALSSHNIRTEVDRYIAWPGQALAYKMGELKILSLRKYAAEKLGPAFEVAAFHDQVLAAGGIPLYLLEERVKAWVEEKISHKN